uniref:Theileria-specific sub-telomeric protein, putative n=1 Tax=Theileria annulata TaxID=5874 RepID=A0A3B0MYQ5_THEAN
MTNPCPVCSDGQQGAYPNLGKCPLLIAAYVLAGLAMMLNIRLSYSSAPYALIRFKLPENLFSVFVRRMASALELWCLPSMLLGNIWDVYYKKQIYNTSKEDKNKNAEEKAKDRLSKFRYIIIPSIISQWLNFLTYVLLMFVYLIGGDQGHLTTFYLVIAISGVVFGINMVLLYSVDFYYIPVYIAGENSFPALTSFIHYIATLIFGNRRKWSSDFLLVTIDIGVAIIISFVAAMVWTIGYGIFAGKYPEDTANPGEGDLKHIHAFGFFASPNWPVISPFLMVIVGMGLVYAIYPGIAPGMIVPFYLIDKIEMVLLVATFFPPVIFAILRKEAPEWSPSTSFVDHKNDKTGMGGWTHYISTHQATSETQSLEEQQCDPNKETKDVHAYLWHFFDILMVIKIVLAYIFIYSLHYRESSLSRAIVNQPKMSTFLSIVFYMCHECLLAIGFPGVIGNGGGDYVLIPQYIGALFMIFLAFYSEGYIIGYKSHIPAHWPTDGMWHILVLFVDYFIGWLVFIYGFYYDKV